MIELTDHRPSPPARPMDSAEVLQILVDLWRQREGIDAGEQVEIPLHRETNIELAANLIGLPRFQDEWHDIAVAMMDIFRVQLPVDEWRRVIEPRAERTLGPLCDRIAEAAVAPLVERRFEGITLNWQAAAFRTILLILDDAGVDVSGISPRTRLAPFLRSSPHVIVHCLSRINPGRMPPLVHINWWFRGSAAAVVIGLALLIFVEAVLVIRHLDIAAKVLLIGGFIGLLSSSGAPALVRLGDLHTFYDLSYALTSPPPAGMIDVEPGSCGHWGRAFHPQPPRLVT